MGATLDALHQLQAIETKLHGYREKIEAKRREVRVMKGRLAKVKEADQTHHDKATDLQKEIDQLELVRASRETEIAKFREQMKVTKTNKEYAAIRVQINTLDANNRKLEDRILGLMTQSDELASEDEAIKSDLAQQTERLEKHQGELADIEAETGPKIEALLAERQEASFNVPVTALQIFERVAEHHDSQAMARIYKPNPKRDEFICEGCQITVTLEAVNAIMSTDDIQVCNVCGRILYLEAPATTDHAPTS